MPHSVVMNGLYSWNNNGYLCWRFQLVAEARRRWQRWSFGLHSSMFCAQHCRRRRRRWVNDTLAAGNSRQRTTLPTLYRRFVSYFTTHFDHTVCSPISAHKTTPAKPNLMPLRQTVWVYKYVSWIIYLED